MRKTNRKKQVFIFILIMLFVIFAILLSKLYINKNNISLQNNDIANNNMSSNSIVNSRASSDMENDNNDLDNEFILMPESIDNGLQLTLGTEIVLPPGSTSSDLQIAVNNAASDDTIVISSDMQFLTMVTIPAEKTLTIQSDLGNDWIMAQNNASVRHFRVNGNLILQNIILDGATVGGGIESFSSGTFTMKDGTVIQNCYSQNGGAMRCSGQTVNILGGAIKNNVAQLGGGLCIEKSAVLNMSGGVLSNNKGTTHGGAIYLHTSTFNMTGGEITENNAAGFGGAVCAAQYDEINVSNGIISKNRASNYGGAFYLFYNSKMNLTGESYISENTATNDGGGIYLMMASALNTSNTNYIINNTAGKNGGGIYASSAPKYNTLTTSGSTVFTGNKASVLYLPPIDAATAYPNIGFASTSIYDHPLNNYDINYTSSYAHVNYDSNGGVGSHTGPDVQVGYTDKILSIIDTEITNIGYTFTGWNTSPDGSGTGYNSGDDITLNNNITLYAIWEINEYTVTFETSGGTPIDSQSVPYNGMATKPADPLMEGYNFEGWYTDNITFLNEWDFTTPINENITLYAKWQDVRAYTVTFESNGGTPVDSQRTPFSGLVIRPPDPTREGYIFGGWYTDDGTFENEWDFTTPINDNLTLYAKWKAFAEEYTVTFESNGGSSVDVQVVALGEKITKPFNPTRQCYIFEGWYTDNETFENEWNFDTPISENITLYAKWRENPICTLLKFIVTLMLIILIIVILFCKKIRGCIKCKICRIKEDIKLKNKCRKDNKCNK